MSNGSFPSYDDIMGAARPGGRGARQWVVRWIDELKQGEVAEFPVSEWDRRRMQFPLKDGESLEDRCYPNVRLIIREDKLPAKVARWEGRIYVAKLRHDEMPEHEEG